MAWLAGRTGLVIASNRGEHGVSLYHLPIHGGLARLSGSEGSAQFPSIAGRTLVFQSTVRDTNIWEQGSGLARTIAASTTPEHSPSISPDGKRIAFISKRTGATEVWIADSEDKTVQLTNLGQTYTDSPRWSPDGRTIAFTSHQDGNRDIFLVDVPTRRTKRFTAEPSEEGRPSWSPDGGALYFRSDRSGSQQIWRQPINGGATQVTQHGGFEPFASLTANLIYYIKQRDKPELWSVAPQGGVETQEAAGVMESRWAVGFGGVYFMRLSVPGGVFHWDPLTRQERTVLTLAKHGRIEGGFSANREGTKFAWTQTDSHTADILKATLTLQ